MNWNLNPTRFGFMAGVLMCSLFPFLANAQSKTNLSYGAGVSAGVGSAIIQSDAYKNYMDTTKSSGGFHFNKGATVWLSYSLGKHADLQFGAGYQQTGFTREQSGLTFKNYTYPGIGTGTVMDQSNTKKGISYDYRFHYLQLPVLYNAYLFRSADFKWFTHFTAGITPQILLNHQLVAKTIPGYSIEGKDRFVIDSTGFSARTLAVSLQVGMLMEYRETKHKAYFIQPVIGIYPISVSKSGNAALPYFIQVNVGMLFSGKSQD